MASHPKPEALVVSNAEFLAAVFSKLDHEHERLHLCGFSGDPGQARGAAWAGRAHYENSHPLPVAQNTYVAIASFRRPAAGERARRAKDQFSACHLVVVDDAKDVPLLPSYSLQTGPESRQVGYILEVPCGDIARVDRLMQALSSTGRLGGDPSGNNAVRYVRLPEGRNEKSKHGAPFTHVLHEWEPTRRYSMQALEEAFCVGGVRDRGATQSAPVAAVAAPHDFAGLVADIQRGEGYHDRLNRTALRLVRDGVPPHAVKGILRGLMDASAGRAVDLDRWRARVADIDRSVDSAVTLHERSREEAADARQPMDILREHPVAGFTEACVPAAIWDHASTVSEATGFDRSGSILADTVAAAAVVDDRRRLHVRGRTDWFESARLWGALIGPPSAGKTPTIRASTGAIKELHRDVVEQWQKDNPDPDAKDATPRPAIYTGDATVEKLADLCAANPRGLLLVTEELASWLGGIDAYRDGAGTKGRGDWLQMYDGGPHQVDRVKRGSIFVPNWSCGVLAAATPAGLRAQLRQLPDDGLIHRFLVVLLKRPGNESDIPSRAAQEAWGARLRRVFASSTCATTTAAHRLSVEAQVLFDRERLAIRDTLDAVAELSPALASHIGKHPGMLARVALTFHVIDERPGDAIEADTMRQAIAFLRVTRRHAAAMYLGILTQSPALELARALARTILAGGFADVGRHTFTQHCRAWRAAADAIQRQAVQLLVDADWLVPDTESRAYGGWSASHWFVAPAVHDRFAEHGREHLARRAQMREAIAGAGDAS